MPTVLRIGKFRFFFFSDEGREPCHIHVECGDGHAKFWLSPKIHLASSQGMNARELAEISQLVRQNDKKFMEAWHEFFSRKN
ncbi:MAG: DUF4160 domain-containing protein [Bdellovibrionota bacterium]